MTTPPASQQTKFGFAGDPREWPSQSAGEEQNTLFLVGDPMQSIYGFRKAEVTLFEDARQGQASLPTLTACQLKVNFRSGAPLVDWYNRVFSRLLRESNQVTGAVQYSPSGSGAGQAGWRRPSRRPDKPAPEFDGVHLYGVPEGDREAEAACVAAIAGLAPPPTPAGAHRHPGSRPHAFD